MLPWNYPPMQSLKFLFEKGPKLQQNFPIHLSILPQSMGFRKQILKPKHRPGREVEKTELHPSVFPVIIQYPYSSEKVFRIVSWVSMGERTRSKYDQYPSASPLLRKAQVSTYR